MKRIWLVTSILVVLALVVSACQGTSPTTSPATTKPGASGTPSGQFPLKTPKYGGTITTAIPAGYVSFDLMQTADISAIWAQMTHNEPMGGDWTKGPLGSKQTNWNWGWVGDTKLITGEVAESWDLPDPTTIVFHLRKNVRWAKNPKAQFNSVVNGREMVADDWVWSLEQAFNNPTNWQARQYPPGDVRRPTSFKATDKYTLEVKVPADSQALMLFEIGGNNHIKAPELWKTAGADNTKWQNDIGTGPFILDDYVDGSQAVFVKNPDYFGTDPLHNNNKTPYVDKVQVLILPDIATRNTALRTGKLDFMGSLTPAVMLGTEDAKLIQSQVPALRSYRRIMSQNMLWGRQDKAPFNDINVRRALNLAVDKQAILKDYFKGDGELLAYPFPPGPDWSKYRTELKDMPADVQELYTGFNPDKAKKMLADAGYPNGFKAEVVVSSVAPGPDEVSLLAGYLSKVGVTLDIKVTDPTTYSKASTANDFKDMFYAAANGIWAPYEQLMVKAASGKTIVTDPYFADVGKVIARDWVKNPDNYFKTTKEAGVKELQSANAIWMPVPYKYNMWWPWLGGYEGIGWTGWADVYDWMQYLWIDPDIKKANGF